MLNRLRPGALGMAPNEYCQALCIRFERMFRMRLVRLAISSLVVVFLNASAIAQSTNCKGVPALSVIAKNGERSTLIGSYHVAAAGLRQPASTVMNGAKHYVVEHRGGSKPPLAHAQRADWSKALSEEQIAVLRERVSCNDPWANTTKRTEEILSYESAATAANFAMSHCSLSKAPSRDVILGHIADNQNLIPEYLELDEPVEKQRRDIPEHIYRHILITAFTPASEHGQRRAIDGLNSGNYEEITSALRDLAANQDDADTYRRIMIVERNRAWMPNLMRHIDEGKAFINVGAAHLPGQDGLIQLLRNNGYLVEEACLPATSHAETNAVKSNITRDAIKIVSPIMLQALQSIESAQGVTIADKDLRGVLQSPEFVRQYEIELRKFCNIADNARTMACKSSTPALSATAHDNSTN